MTSQPDDTRHEAAVRYLLGELTEEECDRLEEAYFATREGFEELRAVEAELTDAYVAGQLSPERRLRFESRLVPGEHGDVQFARALRAVLHERQPPVARAEAGGRRRRLPWLPAAAAALFMAAAGWLVWRAPRPQELPDPARGPASPPASPQSQAAQATPRPPDRSRTLFVPLTAGLTRNDRGLPRVVIPSEVERVVFGLALEGESRTTYAAVLQNASGDGLLEVSPLQERVGAQGRVVDVPVRAGVLPAGDYVLQLQSRDGAGR